MPISFLHWNIRGYRAGLPFLRFLLHQYHIDIFCLQEIKIHNFHGSIPGYHLFDYVDPSMPGGGLVMGFRTHLPFRNVSHDFTSSYVYQIAEVFFGGHPHRVINFYSSVGLTDSTVYDTVTSSSLPQFLLGDFNSHCSQFGSYKHTSAGSTLYQWYEQSTFQLLNTGGSTHSHPCNPVNCVLDLSFASTSVASRTQWFILADTFNSDHHPILFTLDVDGVHASRFFHGYNLKKFHFFLDCLDSLPQFADLSLYRKLQKLTDLLHSPVPRTRTNFWWNREVHAFIQRKRKALKIAHRFNTPQAWSAYHHRKALAQLMIRRAKRTAWEKYLSKLTDLQIFRLLTTLKKRCLPQPPSHFLLQVNHQLVSSPQPQAEALLSYFVPVNHSQYPAFSSSSSLPHVCEAPFELGELRSAIQVSRNSAPGPDGIPLSFIQLLPEQHLLQLLHLYNEIWISGEIPQSWLNTTIIPVLKPGKDPSLLTSYRPISLTSTLIKLQEKMILRRLMAISTQRNIFHDNQYGFLPKRSAVDCASAIYFSLIQHRKQKHFVYLLAVDLQSAYDSVDRSLLLQDVATYFPYQRLLAWLHKFLQPRLCRVLWRQWLSHFRYSADGVPQGAVLSPFLFNLYLLSLFYAISSNSELYIFADDIYIVVYGSTESEVLDHLSSTLSQLESWCAARRFIISAAKTKLMNCSSRRIATLPTVVLSSCPLQWVNQLSILGVIFSSNLRWKAHFTMLLRKCGAFTQICKLISSSSVGCNPQVLLSVFKRVLLPALTYGSFLTSSSSKTHLAKIQVIINNNLRRIMCIPRACPVVVLHRECSILPFSTMLFQQNLFYVLRHLSFCSGSYWSRMMRSIFYHPAVSYCHFPPAKLILLGLRQFGILPQPLLSLSSTDYILPSTVSFHVTPLPDKKQNLSASTIFQCFMELAQQFPTDTYTWIFTDGSKSPAGCGIGVYVSSSHCSYSFPISPLISSFSAEIYAIMYALDRFCCVPGHYVFATDNLGVLSSLQRGGAKVHPLITVLGAKLQFYTSDFHLSFLWLPSHVQLPGNLEADQAARSSLTLDLPYLYTSLTLPEYKQYVTSCIYTHLESEWTTSLLYRKYGHVRFLTNPHLYMNLPRGHQILLHLLRTLTAPLNKFLHQVKKRDSPDCVVCGCPETVFHFFQDCTRYQALRQSLQAVVPFQDVRTVLFDSYHSVSSIQALLSFAIQSQRFRI